MVDHVRRLKTIAAVLLLLTGAVASCGKAKEEPKKPPDPLAELFPALAIHFEMTKLNLQFCEVMSQIKSSPGLEATDTQRSAICTILNEAARNNAAIAASALATKTLPGNLFFFYEVKPANGDELGSTAVGFFPTMNECKAAEEVYRQFDIATRTCRRWDGHDFSILG